MRPVALLVILLLSIKLLSFPLPEVAPANTITPLPEPVSEPLILQYFTVLFSAERIKRMVEAEALLRVLSNYQILG